MPYLQLTLHYHYPTSETSISDEDLSDWLISELGTIGFESFEQGEGMVKAFIPQQDYREEVTRELLTAFPLEGFTCDFAILSTSRGVMTDKEASQLKVGGEVLCYIY